MSGVPIRNFTNASGGVFYNGGVPYDSSGALLVNGGINTGLTEITVGTNGTYSTIQAAVNYILTLPQFTYVTATGTVASKSSRNITGSGTAFTTALAGNRYVALGTPNKWYPVRSVLSDTVMRLCSPFQETISGGEAIYIGKPVIRRILILDALTEDVFITSDGTSTGAAVNSACISFEWAPGVEYSGTSAAWGVAHRNKSGILIFKGINSRDKDYGPYISVAAVETGTDYYTTVDMEINDCFIRNNSGVDFVYGLGSSKGRFWLRNSDIQTNFDNIQPNVSGGCYLSNSKLYVLPTTEAITAENLRPFNTVFSQDGAEAYFSNCELSADCSNPSSPATLADLRGVTGASAQTASHYIFFNKVDFNLKLPIGATAGASQKFIDLAIDNSDIYFNECSFTTNGVAMTSLPATCRGFYSEAAVANRLYFNNTAPPDVRNLNTNLTVSKFSGAQNRVHVTTVAATLSTNELDYLRADTFTLALGATLITSIPIVANAPDGAKLKFIFTQDATGGRNVSGWAATYVFHTAWSNTGNTASKVSIVEFEKSGANWYQVGAANTWL